MKKTNFITEIFTLCLPVAGQLLLSSLVSMLDNVMIGQMGEVNISAVSIATTYTWLVSVFVYGCVKGAAIIGAQKYGRNEIKTINKLLSFVILFGTFASIIFFIITEAFTPEIMKIYSTFDDVIEPGVNYLNIAKYSYIPNGIAYAIICMLQTVKSVKIGMISSIASCTTNVIFNYLLIQGNLGFPALGIEGASIATLIARIVECLTVIIYLLFFDKKLNFKIKDFDPRVSKDDLEQLIFISIPLLLTDVLENLTSSAQTMITGRLSEYYLSANSIVHTCWNLPSVFCFGAGTAAAIMIGNSLGRKDYDKAKKDAKRLVITAFVIGAFCSIMVKILVPIVSSFYSVSEQTLDLAYKMGNMACINVIFISCDCIIANGILKATGATKRILTVTLIGKWLFATPLGYIGAFYLNWPAEIIYFVLRSGNIVITIWALAVLAKGEWMATI